MLKNIAGWHTQKETQVGLTHSLIHWYGVLRKHLFCSFYHIMQTLDRDANHHFVIFDICVLAAATASNGHSNLSGLIWLRNTICAQVLFSCKIRINASTESVQKCLRKLHYLFLITDDHNNIRHEFRFVLSGPSRGCSRMYNFKITIIIYHVYSGVWHLILCI